MDHPLGPDFQIRSGTDRAVGRALEVGQWTVEVGQWTVDAGLVPQEAEEEAVGNAEGRVKGARGGGSGPAELPHQRALACSSAASFAGWGQQFRSRC